MSSTFGDSLSLYASRKYSCMSWIRRTARFGSGFQSTLFFGSSDSIGILYTEIDGIAI